MTMSEQAPDRFSCGYVNDEEFFSDQLCLVCGHPPCPCCGRWCDVIGKLTERSFGGEVYQVVEDDPDDPDGTKEHPCDRCGRMFVEHGRGRGCPDGDGHFEHETGMCCDAECTYSTPPRFFLLDGSEYRG